MIVWTNVGRGLFAARDAGGSAVTIDNMRLGKTTSYDPTASQTALQDPSPVRVDFKPVAITATGGIVSIPVPYTLDSPITLKEVGFFSGDNLIVVRSAADGSEDRALAANQLNYLTLTYEYSGSGTPTTPQITVTVNVPQKATNTDVDTETNDSKWTSVLKVYRAIGRRLSNLPTTVTEALTTLASNDRLVVTDVSDTNASKYITTNNLRHQMVYDRSVGSFLSKIVWDCKADPYRKYTLTGNTTISNPTTAEAGRFYILELEQDSTGGHTVTWGDDFDIVEGDLAPESTGGSIMMYGFLSTGTEMLSFPKVRLK